MTTILIATNNPGKLAEFNALYHKYCAQPPKLISAQELGIAAPEETGASFAANALLKAKFYSQASGLPALADDSGLCVDALGGAPGIFSARYGGPDTLYANLLALGGGSLAGLDLSASFHAALCLYDPSGTYQQAAGEVQGKLVFPGRGKHGFGYDPIFSPYGSQLTFAEMTSAAKQEISHRNQAFKRLISAEL